MKLGDSRYVTKFAKLPEKVNGQWGYKTVWFWFFCQRHSVDLVSGRLQWIDTTKFTLDWGYRLKRLSRLKDLNGPFGKFAAQTQRFNRHLKDFAAAMARFQALVNPPQAKPPVIAFSEPDTHTVAEYRTQAERLSAGLGYSGAVQKAAELVFFDRLLTKRSVK